MTWATAALVAMLALAGVVAARREPRRLRVGVLLAAAVGLALVGAIGRTTIAITGGDVIAIAWALLGAIVLGLLALTALGVFNLVNGVVMMRREGLRAATGLSFAFGVLIVTYVGLVGATWVTDLRGAPVARDLFWAAVLIGLPAMHLAFVFIAFVGYAWLYAAVVRRRARPADVVIVLGAGLSGERVTPLLSSRLNVGRTMLESARRSGVDARLICSGGQGADETVPEAIAMRSHLVDSGLDAALIWLEDRSTSTQENLQLSAQVAAEHGRPDARFAVVTSDFHAFRAALLMRRLGLTGHAFGARTAGYFWPSAVLREYAAILRDHRRLNGAVLALLCAPLPLALLVRLSSAG